MNKIIVSILLSFSFFYFSCSPDITSYDKESGIVELSFDPQQSEDIVVEMIDGAESSIYMALYGFDNDNVAAALIRAHRRGVDVKAVTEYDSEHYDSYQALINEGISVVLGNGGDQSIDGTYTDTKYDAIMHNKYFIIDMKYIITGSTNLTSGLFVHFNNLIVLKSADLASDFKTDFDVMRAGYFGIDKDSGFDIVHGTGPLTVEPRQVGPYVIRSYFTPYNYTLSDYGDPTGYVYNYLNYDSGGRETVNYQDARNIIISLVQNAKTSVRFLVFSFTDRVIIDEMIKAKERGVDVKIWMDHASYAQSDFVYNSYNKMAEALGEGAKICRRHNSGLLHHKVVWVDNETLVTGSLNFSKSAGTKNDENFLVIENASSIIEGFEAESRRIDGESISITNYNLAESGYVSDSEE